MGDSDDWACSCLVGDVKHLGYMMMRRMVNMLMSRTSTVKLRGEVVLVGSSEQEQMYI